MTNALNVALTIGAATEAQVILLGGTLSREASSTVGPLDRTDAGRSDACRRSFSAPRRSIWRDGLTDTTLEIAQVKRAMIKAAKQVILLADSSKWDHTGFIKVAPLAEIDALISDDKTSGERRAAIERLGIQLLVV